ncbi:helix-turn-helix transcriptional regulator [Bythopirellula goksoeyrii]|uniref:Helix-turn-helix protein n=1 Tax=Bythopirellula goksoeyrii TaxID=1400387 RepID=A0A5B9QAQ7_9BACT|nr:helix-turn-helix transcriptional regulator [Bythopirellula goksoeyrii]QEG36077.1 helix-turn-helix protein [Bythopirellula goksoeyrii]
MAKKTNKSTDGVSILRSRYDIDISSDESVQQWAEPFRVAQLLFDARTAAGLTQGEIAEKVGTTQSVISQLESADYEGHSLSMLRRIAAALGSHVEIRLVPGSKEPAA